MPFVDFNQGPIIEVWKGVSGTIAHSDQATYCHFTVENQTLLPEHSHAHEQWCHVISGELEFTISGETKLLTAGMSAYIPAWAPHSAFAHTECRVIDCFTPVREDFKALQALE